MEHLQQSEKIAAPSTKCSNYRSKFLVSGWKAFIYGVLDSRRPTKILSKHHKV